MSLSPFIFGASSLLLGGWFILGNANLRLPADNQGFQPEQPIAFSHRLHAGEMGMECQYCHFGARQSRSAGVPPASLCMNCHRKVTSGLDSILEEKLRAKAEQREPEPVISSELQKLYDALGLNAQQEPEPGLERHSIEWVRVHNLPDFVNFDHRPHVASKLACQTCHGPVESMERMRQESPLSMGWCLDCHRKTPSWEFSGTKTTDLKVGEHVSTNCVTCHL